MRIQKTQENPCFGYNQALNERVIQSLTSAKNNRPFFDTLLKINSMANETENLLRTPVIAKNKPLVSKLEDAFIVLKSYFADCMDAFFPKLNYSAVESVSYLKEITENPKSQSGASWNANIMNILSEKVTKSMPQRLSIGMDENGNLAAFNEDGEFIKEVSLEELPEEVQEMVKEKQETLKVKIEAEKAAKEEQEENSKISDLVEKFVPNGIEKLGFAGLIGLDDVKSKLQRRVINMLKDPEEAKILAKDYGKKMPKGILLYGPPGCGKTSIAKAISVEAGIPLLIPKAKLGDGLIHQTANNIESVYSYAKSIATPEKPVLILFDDCEAAFMSRAAGRLERFNLEEMTAYLKCIEDGAKNNVITIATTNKIFLLDDAIQGRLGMQFELPFPDLDTRKSILVHFMKPITSCQNLIKDDDAMTKIAEKLYAFQVRDYDELIQNATDKAAFDVNGKRDVTLQDFMEEIETPAFQNKKIDMKIYESKASRKPVGFNLLPTKEPTHGKIYPPAY